MYVTGPDLGSTKDRALIERSFISVNKIYKYISRGSINSYCPILHHRNL